MKNDSEMIEEHYDRNFLIAGRRCGGCEDTVAYVCVGEDEDPEAIFIRDILYGGSLPDDWEDRLPTYEENDFGEWAYINGTIELPFGISGTGDHPQALELKNFRLENGKILAHASVPSADARDVPA